MRHDILGYTDAQIKEQDRQIAYERNVGIIPDPNAQMAAEDEEALAQEGQPVDLAGGQVPQDDMDLSGDPAQELPNSVDIMNAAANLNK